MASRNPRLDVYDPKPLAVMDQALPPFGRSVVALFATMPMIASLELLSAESS
jgi:hypothetical protein